MSADSEKPNITGGIWMKYCTVTKSMVGIGQILSKWTAARASLALCGRVDQFQSPYSWIAMRRSLRKRRIFDFVPSYLKLKSVADLKFSFSLGKRLKIGLKRKNIRNVPLKKCLLDLKSVRRGTTRKRLGRKRFLQRKLQRTVNVQGVHLKREHMVERRFVSAEKTNDVNVFD